MRVLLGVCVEQHQGELSRQVTLEQSNLVMERRQPRLSIKETLYIYTIPRGMDKDIIYMYISTNRREDITMYGTTFPIAHRIHDDENPSSFIRNTTEKSNGGKSLKQEHLQRYKDAQLFMRLLGLI